jgi:hypothetical protein
VRHGRTSEMRASGLSVHGFTRRALRKVLQRPLQTGGRQDRAALRLSPSGLSLNARRSGSSDRCARSWLVALLSLECMLPSTYCCKIRLVLRNNLARAGRTLSPTVGAAAARSRRAPPRSEPSRASARARQAERVSEMTGSPTECSHRPHSLD